MYATSTIPIVAGLNPDPVNTGLIESFSRPGGGVTGLYAYGASELVGKRLELLKETLPSLARVAVICDSFSREGSSNSSVPPARSTYSFRF